MSFSVISDCLIVRNIDHTDGHYMSHYKPISYKHVESHQGITLMDITRLFITLFHINILVFPGDHTDGHYMPHYNSLYSTCLIKSRGITLMDITHPTIIQLFVKNHIIYIYFDKDTREV